MFLQKYGHIFAGEGLLNLMDMRIKTGGTYKGNKKKYKRIRETLFK